MFSILKLFFLATFHHNNHTSESQVDHIYFYIPEKCKLDVRFKEHICLKNNPTNISSHDVIVGEIFFPPTKEAMSEIDYSESYTDFIVKKPKWHHSNTEEYEAQTTRILKELSETYNDKAFIPTLCEMFSRALVISAENNIETVDPKTIKSGKNLPFFSKEYKNAHNEHKRIFSVWKRAGRPVG